MQRPGTLENWKDPQTGEWLRTFCIITTTANDLVGQVHNRMPVIIPPDAYERWLAHIEPDPRDLLALPAQSDEDVAHLDACEQTRER
jgi:putative SOS response-associated peptidase YedK